MSSWTLTALLTSALATPALSQTPPASELQRRIEHLGVVGSVLYVAAHPDDENTRLISYLVGDRGMQTAYLSMTRGGGGQNLIGSEQSELLAAVRSGELLAARSVDGGHQLFTRARDFGYSKSPEEALSFWGHDEALADVVLAVRTFRPDVIITRFASDGGGHGHHTASARLAAEAFEAAADPQRFPELGDPWQADRILRNQSTWRLGPDADTSHWMSIDVGTFDPRTGRSFGEVAATSRTMHKSQGFGSSPRVGSQIEYFSPIAGTPLTPSDDPFTGLDLGWTRFDATRPLVKAIDRAAARFDATAPQASLPELARIHQLMSDQPAGPWRTVKLAEVEQLMVDCAGLWLDVTSDKPAVAPGGSALVSLLAVNRSGAPVSLLGASLEGAERVEGGELEPNAPWTVEQTLTIPADRSVTQPHWLAASPSAARWRIDDPSLRNLSDTPPDLWARFDVEVAGLAFEVRRPVRFTWTDRVDGERSHPLEILPPATASFDQRGLLVPRGTEATTRITLRAGAGPASGTLTLTAPDGVTITPSSVEFQLTEGALEQILDIQIAADESAAPGPLEASVVVGGTPWSLQQSVIDYGHLPRRTILQPAALQLTPVDLDRGAVSRVGYVPGSGDAVPEVLRSVGYVVEELDEDAIAAGGLERFDAIVLGIRAYNTRPRLMALNDQLLTYVQGGGRVVAQYNTNSRWSQLPGPIGPAPFTIGRGRVTDETAELVAVDPKHPALTAPNVLGPADFDGWVQERGLYFASEWADGWTPLFSVHDPGEEPLEGSTLIAEHGDGVFVYTGVSFFRQLPAGVPGATRLLANLMALGGADE